MLIAILTVLAWSGFVCSLGSLAAYYITREWNSLGANPHGPCTVQALADANALHQHRVPDRQVLRRLTVRPKRRILHSS